MPTTATAMALVATTVATDHMVSDTAMASTTARGRLRLSPRLMPITDTEATDLADSTVATGLTVSDMATVSTTTARGRLSPNTVSTLLTTLLPLSGATPIMPSLPLLSLTPSTLSTPLWSPATPRSPPLPPSPPSALPPLPSPLSEEPTLVPDATSPTPLELSMLPRGRLRLTPTTTEDTEDTVSDTAVDTTGVRFCLDVLDLDATTLCPWIGSRRIWNSLEVQILKLLHLA